MKLPIKTGTGTGGGGADIDEVNIFKPDPLKTFSETAVGLAGMKVDWKFFDKFESVVKNDPVVKQKYDQGDVKGAEEYVKTEIFDKPEDYFSLDKLRKSVKADRRITLKEFIEKILAGFPDSNQKTSFWKMNLKSLSRFISRTANTRF